MIRIVLADDHPQIRRIWHYILSSNAAFEVVARCCNGQEAIEAASAYAPDVLLIDINMQPVNGIEATEIISRLYPDIKIIGMSIHIDAVYVKRMLQAGAHGYVSKNSSYGEVFEAISKVHAGQYFICSEVEEKIPGLLLTLQ